jgi:hypothetical protein
MEQLVRPKRIRDPEMQMTTIELKKKKYIEMKEHVARHPELYSSMAFFMRTAIDRLLLSSKMKRSVRESDAEKSLNA